MRSLVATAAALALASAADTTSFIDVPRAMVQTLQSNLPIGSQRLLVMQGFQAFVKNIVPFICGGNPALVAYTPTLGPNGACFEGTAWSALESNLSCTCLNYVSETEWTFRIKNSDNLGVEKKLPPEIRNETVLEVDSSMMYGVKPSVKTLNLIGVGPLRVPITLMNNPINGAKTDVKTLIISQTDATISTLYVENIEFSAPIVDGFVPTILKNLTMKNCNISSFSPEIVKKSLDLATLDISNNSIGDDSLKGISSDSLTTLNLTSNSITSFSSWLLDLSKLSSLSLKNNPISNRTVSNTMFEAMTSKLKSFDLDPIQSCSEGDLQTVASAQFCVLKAPIPPPPPPPPPDSGSGNTTKYLIIGLIAGCAIIAVLVFLLVKKNSCRSSDEPDFGKEPLDAYFDNTVSYDDTHPTVSASLLNDPIVITNRIPYNDIRVANCISKGGFGLVYSGVYNRRRVAIKKIRPDRAGDIKMIEAFLKEICLMATLHHARIVEFVGVSWDSLRNLCAVTEFMDRGDLREVLQGFKLRNTPLTWDSHKTKISLHIAEGLTYLHSLSPKVIHRDLKSKNVLLNNEMEAKLSDFGISRERRIEETHMTAGIGTSFWIAPEVLLGKDYDERADIFSFGVVLSEIDTDDYPYWNASNPNVGNKAQENMILQMVASGAMRPSFSDSCPKAVLELADLCLKVEPEDRPTAAEVAYRLQQIVAFMNPPSGTGSLV